MFTDISCSEEACHKAKYINKYIIYISIIGWRYIVIRRQEFYRCNSEIDSWQVGQGVKDTVLELVRE